MNPPKKKLHAARGPTLPWDEPRPIDARPASAGCAVVGQTFHEAGLAEGTEVVRQNKDLKALSAKKGLVFNDVDAEAFRQRLRGAGFWSKWQQRFGAETWDTLPKKVGKLT